MADRYLVATGNWNSTDTWSDESGGDPGASVPGSSDNVFLDANSGAAVLTVNVASSCLNFDCTGFTGTLAGGSVNFTVQGNLKFVSGMSLTRTGDMILSGGGSVTIDSGGLTLPTRIYLMKTGTNSLTLNSDLTISGNTLEVGGTCNFVANAKKITMVANSSGALRGTWTESKALYDFEYKPATGAVANLLYLFSEITVTNNLVLDSNSTDADRRLLITSNMRGTARTITCNGTVTANYCDFEDITGAGTADWDLSAATGLSGDCGGNTDVTFTTPATVYQVGTGNQDFSADVWKTTSNGATAARRPLPQDTAVLDASSTTGTMTQNLQRIGTISAAAFTGTLTTTTACVCYGSITLGSEMTLTASTQAYTLAGRGTHTLTSAGKTWAKGFTIDAPGGSYTLQDDFSSSGSITFTRGTFDANNYNATLSIFFRSGSATAVVDLGNGIWTITGTQDQTWSVLNLTGLTITPGTSTIKFTGTLANWRLLRMAGTYYNVEFATTGSFGFTINDAPTFNGNFKVAPGSNVQFYRSETVTAASWTLEGTSGSPITLASSDGTLTANVAKVEDGDLVVANYATITRLTATPYQASPPILRWYATNSTGVGTTTGWTFSAPPAAGLTVMGIEAPAKVNGVALPLVINGVS